MRALVLWCLLGLGAASLEAQPRGGVLRVRLTNGTNGDAGSAEKVTLFRLSRQMVP